MDLKKILKAIKLNESTVSMLLGAVIIIVVGVLVVNYFKDRSKGVLPENGISNQISNDENLTVPGKSYTVVSGDNLWTIAEKTYGSGYNWTDIAKDNDLTNPSKIAIGQVLSLPEVAAKTTTSEVTAVAEKVSPAVSNTISGATYEVVRGDNLWKIAVRAYGDGYKWVEIARENKLVHPNLIHSGNILILPR